MPMASRGMAVGIMDAQKRDEPQPTLNDNPPSNAVWERCAEMIIYDKDGHALPFKSLLPKPDTPHRNLIIFVRHFFCGMCQDYLRQLSLAITPQDLSSLYPPLTISIIGCGSPSLLPEYARNSSCPNFPIYADPSRTLYDALSLTSTLSQGPIRPKYQSMSLLSAGLKSAGQIFGTGLAAAKSGNYSQVGGEFLVGEGGVEWCHRMRNTRDHTEVDVLRRLVGLDGE